MENIIKQNQEWIDSVWQKIEKKLERTAVRSRYKIPYTTGPDGVHDNRGETEVDWWTNGFWGGLMWLMYAETKNDVYRKTAEESEKILADALKNYKVLQHDVGFLYHLTSGANARITGNRAAYNKNLYMAAMLASRYNIDGGYIRAWNSPGDEGWSIIDCMMNIPLLYWASREIGDPRFCRIAMRHADMAVKMHINEDGSSNHIVEHDTETGELVKIYGGQGYESGSCWSRGLAWAIYGMVLSYIHTQKAEYLETAKKCADYYISACRPLEYKTPIDFKGPAEPVYYDSTAGVCTACGLLEIAKNVPDAEAEKYAEAAIEILKATDEHFCDYSEDCDALVLMGSERYPVESQAGVHIPIIYGDFFFAEAILKLKGSKFLIW